MMKLGNRLSLWLKLTKKPAYRLGKTTDVTDDELKANVQIPMTESGKTADLSVASD